jgi:iron complex outermembrane receptor protein
MSSQYSNKNATACILAALQLAVHSPKLHAERAGQPSALEEVVVTAQKEDEFSQNVPLSIATLDQSSMEKRGISDLRDVSQVVPSLVFTPAPQSSSTSVIYMRGVGSPDAEQIARDVGVGIYLDDIYLGRMQGLSAQMIDLERIEVLRGPQGTLYGRNTIGGAIKFVTLKPSGEWGFKQSLDVGNRGRFQSSTSIDFPTTANISAKLSYLKSDVDGWVNNNGTGGDFGEKYADGYRLALRWQPLEDVTVDYAYDHSDQEGTSYYAQRSSNPAPYGVPVPTFRNRIGTAYRPVNVPLKDDYKQHGHALTIAWAVSEALTLKSVSAYRTIETDTFNDTVEAYGLPSLVVNSAEAGQFTQEFLINGSMPIPQLDYVIGLFLFNQTADQSLGGGPLSPFTLLANPFDLSAGFLPPTEANLDPAKIAHIHNKSRAVYGNLTWVPSILDDNLSIVAGARYSHDDRGISRFIESDYLDEGDTGYSSFDPTVTVDYRLSDASHIYYRWARAYRAGGYSLRTTVLEPYDKETLVSNEVGLKSKWWDDRIRFNISGFRSKYDDIQYDFIDMATLYTHTINAASATISGIEADFAIIPIEGLQIDGNYTWLDGDLATVFDPFNQTVLEDADLASTPRNRYALNTEYTFAPFDFGGVLSARVGYAWTDRQSSGMLPKAPSYGLVDGRITLGQIPMGSRGRLSAALWGKNLANKDYVINRLFGADIYGEKRSYGINLIFNY